MINLKARQDARSNDPLNAAYGSRRGDRIATHDDCTGEMSANDQMRTLGREALAFKHCTTRGPLRGAHATVQIHHTREKRCNGKTALASRLVLLFIR